MLHDIDSLSRVARWSHQEAVSRARSRRALHDAGIPTGPRAALASVLRGLANRVDDAPVARSPGRREPAT